jgi:hypothetical protein
MITSSATSNTTQAAPLCIAARIGLKSAEVQVCEWLNGLIHNVGEPIKSKYPNPGSAYPTKTVLDAIQKTQQEATRRYGRDISVPPIDVPVALSFEAGKVLDDQTVKIDPAAITMFGTRAGQDLNFENWMNKQVDKSRAPRLRFKVEAETPKCLRQEARAAAVFAQKHSLQLKDGDTVHEYILDDKFAGAAFNIGREDSLVPIPLRESLSEAEMSFPSTYPFRNIPAESKLGRNKEQEKKIGFHASSEILPALLDNLYNRYAYDADYKDSESLQLTFLNKALTMYGIDSDLKIRDLNDSKIKNPENWTSEKIIQAAKKADRLATGILQFAIINSGKAIAKAITLQKEGNSKPVSLLNLSGSFITALRDAVDRDGSLLFNAINNELEKLGHPGIEARRIIVADPSQVTDSLADAKTRLQAMFQNPQAV